MRDTVRVMLFHKESPEEAFDHIRHSRDKEAARVALSYCDKHSLHKVAT